MWVAVAALSVVNATAEEVVWRHCLPGSVRAGTGSTAAACLVSSASFAAMHWHAIPSGPSGVLLTFAFAVAAFVAVRLTGSLLPSITAHLVADLVLIHWLIG
jgi:membrane protease YdiL (CAAX protease family)